MKDVIKGVNNKEKINEYIRDNKKFQEDSSKKKSCCWAKGKDTNTT